MSEPTSDGVPDGVPDASDLTRLVDRVERSLLGGPREYTRLDMAERSGLPADEIRALWRAMGFATVEDDEQVFTETDLDALRTVRELSELVGIDADVMLAMARMIGQSFARLASWQGQVVIDAVSDTPQMFTDDDGARVVELVDNLTPMTATLHEYVWRRQMAAYFRRVSSSAGASAQTLAVGFADMAAFTAFTRRSSETELRTVLEEFESVATDVVAGNHGQIVKTIGDEILFVADDPHDAAEIALGLVEAAEQSSVLPQLRVGLASGPVVSRLGDVFGQTVNIASRLTSVARTDSVLVDEGLHDALVDDPRFRFSALRPVSVRGYHHLRSWRLRRG